MSKHQRQTAARLTERWGFRILAATLIAVPLVFDGDLLRFTLLPKRLAVQIGLLLLLMLLTRDVLNTDRPCIPRSILNLPTLAYALVTATALLWAGNVVAAIESVSHLLTYVLLFFAAVTTVRREQTPQLAETVCWVGIIVSIIGLGEFWGIDSSIPSNGRPSATFGYRNMAASYLVMAIPFAVGLIATTHSRRTYGIAITSATLMTVFLVYTRTRGAWVALLFAVVVTALFSIPYRPATGSLLSSTWGKRLLAIGALSRPDTVTVGAPPGFIPRTTHRRGQGDASQCAELCEPTRSRPGPPCNLEPHPRDDRGSSAYGRRSGQLAIRLPALRWRRHAQGGIGTGAATQRLPVDRCRNRPGRARGLPLVARGCRVDLRPCCSRQRNPHVGSRHRDESSGEPRPRCVQFSERTRRNFFVVLAESGPSCHARQQVQIANEREASATRGPDSGHDRCRRLSHRHDPGNAIRPPPDGSPVLPRRQ